MVTLIRLDAWFGHTMNGYFYGLLLQENGFAFFGDHTYGSYFSVPIARNDEATFRRAAVWLRERWSKSPADRVEISIVEKGPDGRVYPRLSLADAAIQLLRGGGP